MQTGSTALQNALRTGTALPCSLRLIAEWNQNRYAGIANVVNASGATEYNTGLFPISSIALPARPTQGMVKARATDNTIHTTTGIEGRTTPDFQDTSPTVRYYTSSADAVYKYWCSPVQSDGTGNLTTTQPYVLYSALAWVNKIVIGFEASVTQPTNYTIQTTTNGTTWTTVGTNVALNAAGQAILYLQAGGSWGTTVDRTQSTQILGIRVNVTKINVSNAFLSLIEVSGRLEQDISAYVVSDSDQFDQSNVSFIAPIGQASSNSATVTLSNVDGRWDNDRQWLDYPTNTVPNPYYKMVDKFVEFRMDLGIDTTGFGGSGIEYTRQLTMYSDEWSGQDEDTVDVSLLDAAVLLQNVMPNPTFYQNMTTGEIIWRLCENVGFNNYNYSITSAKSGNLIPYYWTDGTQTVWDAISALSAGTQTAVYVDELGVLQIKTRDAAYDITQSIDWTLDATSVDSALVTAQSRPVAEIGKLPDLASVTTNYSFESNKVNVNYKTTSVSDFQNGFPVMETVWEPDGTTVLRASNLQLDITSSATILKITPADAATWLYTGSMQIEGEIMDYASKEYSYYNPVLGFMSRTYIKSDDEKKALDTQSGAQSYRNSFTGWLGGLTRGTRSSTAKAHSVLAQTYTVHYRTGTGAYQSWVGGGFFDVPGSSIVQLQSNASFGLTSWLTAKGPANPGGIANYYGTRLSFPSSGYKDGIAGMYWSAGTNDSGYYVELTRTSEISSFASGRSVQQELNFYIRNSDGTYQRYGPNGGTGVAIAVNNATWYDIDVYFGFTSPTTGNRDISIAVNGVVQMRFTLTPGQYPAESLTAYYGMFTRGFTIANFDYLYASNYKSGPQFDSESIIAEIDGGYTSQSVNDIIYQTRSDQINAGTKWVSNPVTPVLGSFQMDEFGAVVHEVRDFDIKFSKAPVTHSRLYITNSSQIMCPNYNGNAYGAQFTLVNTARVNAIAEGSDTLTFGADNSVDQKLLIYARTVNQDDVATVTVQDQNAIYRRGQVVLDIDSDWIQSKDMATAIGNWITFHWAGGNDEISVDTFGNPLIQIGDLVAVNFPDKSMFRPTHKYFVASKQTSFDQGYSTSFTLRRARV